MTKFCLRRSRVYFVTDFLFFEREKMNCSLDFLLYFLIKQKVEREKGMSCMTSISAQKLNKWSVL